MKNLKIKSLSIISALTMMASSVSISVCAEEPVSTELSRISHEIQQLYQLLKLEDLMLKSMQKEQDINLTQIKQSLAALASAANMSMKDVTDMYTQAIASQRKENADLRSKIANLEQKLATQKEEMNKLISFLENKIKSIEADNNKKLDDQISNQTKVNISIAKDIANLKQKVDSSTNYYIFYILDPKWTRNNVSDVEAKWVANKLVYIYQRKYGTQKGSSFRILQQIAVSYVEETLSEGIDLGVAFGHALLTTDGFEFLPEKGLRAETRNFGGIMKNGKYIEYKTIREGVKAHVKALKDFASANGGNSATVNDLAKKWYADENYGKNLNNLLIELFKY